MTLPTAERSNVLSNTHVLISTISERIFSMSFSFAFFMTHSNWQLLVTDYRMGDRGFVVRFSSRYPSVCLSAYPPTQLPNSYLLNCLSVCLSVYISDHYYCSFLISACFLSFKFTLLNLLYSVSFSFVSLFLVSFILTISASLSLDISFSFFRV
jgi:hypothetical protein